MSRRAGTLADQERGSRFVGFVVRLFFGLTLVTLYLSLIQCSIKTPASPSWDTNLTLPLIERTYPMTELVNKIDSKYLSVDSSGAVRFDISRPLDTVRLNASEFSTPNLSQSLVQTLGQISIAPPSIPPTVTPVSAIGPLALVLPGNVPPLNFQVSASLPAAGSYSSMTIAQGTAWLVIENELGIPLSSVSVQLNDIGNAQSLGTFNFASGIPDGVRDSLPVNLAGKILSNLLGVTSDCQTGGGTVLSAANKSLIAEFHFSSNLTVSSATTMVPALSRNVADAFSLNESQIISQAVLQSGTLAIAITNNSSLPATLTISIPDLMVSGNVFSVQQQVGANATVNQSVNLINATLNIADQTLPQSIPVQVSVSSPGSGSNQVTVNASDQFSAAVSLSNLTFASVTGALDVAATIPSTAIAVDVPQGLQNSGLAQAVLTLNITNRFGVAGNYALTLQGDNGKTLNLSGSIASANGVTPVLTTNVDTSVANFLSPLPTNITVTGTAHFGDGVAIGTVRSGDFVVGDVKFSAPFALTLGPTAVNFDVERVNTDGFDKASSDVQKAELVYTVNNHLPLGASLNILFGADSASLQSNPEVNISGITLLPGTLSGGTVISATSTGEQRIILNRAQIDVLRHNPLFVLPVLQLPGSGGQVIRFTGSDFITLTARAEVTYRFDGSF